MRPHVPDAQLTSDDVPAGDAPWEDIVAFGHGYHAYRVAGSLQRVADLTVAAHDQWQREGTLPDALPKLRLALFHTVRATHDSAPAPATEEWARALVAAIARRVTDDATA